MMKPIHNSDVAKALGLLLRSGRVKQTDVLESLKRCCRGHEAVTDAAFEVGLFYCEALGGRFLSAHKFIEAVEGAKAEGDARPADLQRLPFARWYADKYDV